MTYRRRLLRYGPQPQQLLGTLSERVIAGGWFELLRQGGCGRGEVTLSDHFAVRTQLQIGEWVACEYNDGERWYLGRIEQRRAHWPAGITLSLRGMSAQLEGVFPGGFAVAADGRPPHRYAVSDRFPHDPDHARETVDASERPEDVVRLLLTQYVVPHTTILHVPERIEDAPRPAEIISLKFHGEDAVAAILRDLALRAHHAAWGVDALGRFFFLPRRSTPLATYQVGQATVRVVEIHDRRSLFNRVLLTGGYVYGGQTEPYEVPRRWRGNYLEPGSIAQYGERRIRLHVPWIRTPEDARQFVREFFRLYATPVTRYEVQVFGSSVCPLPWEGPVRLLDQDGSTLWQGEVERIRVQFDHTPVLHLELGPPDPRDVWPSNPVDERYPVGYSDGSDGHGGGFVPVDPEEPDEPDEPDDPELIDADCPGCGAVPAAWRVTFQGITHGLCDECDRLNTTFVLPFTGSPGFCHWSTHHAACADSSAALVELFLGAGELTLQITTSGGFTIYRKVGSIACQGVNTLTRIAEAPHCQNWPATVDVEPV